MVLWRVGRKAVSFLLNSIFVGLVLCFKLKCFVNNYRNM